MARHLAWALGVVLGGLALGGSERQPSVWPPARGQVDLTRLQNLPGAVLTPVFDFFGRCLATSDQGMTHDGVGCTVLTARW